MISQDYTKEINVASPQRIVPWRYAALILAALSIGAWFGVRALMNHTTVDRSMPASVTSVAPKP